MQSTSGISAAIFAITLSIVSIPIVFAQPFDQRCRERGAFLKDVDLAEKGIFELDKSVETVPPSEAAYIRKEGQLALEQKNSRRFSVVANSRYYTALKFHDDMQVASDNVTAAKNATNLKQAAIYLTVVISRLGDASVTLTDFIEADSRRSQPTLSAENKTSLYFSMSMLRSSTLILLQCVVGSI